jgi:hypothetical protein
VTQIAPARSSKASGIGGCPLGLLLCQTCKDVYPLEMSLNGAIGYLRTFAA